MTFYSRCRGAYILSIFFFMEYVILIKSIKKMQQLLDMATELTENDRLAEQILPKPELES